MKEALIDGVSCFFTRDHLLLAKLLIVTCTHWLFLGHKSSLHLGQCILEQSSCTIPLYPLSLSRLMACCDRQLKSLYRLKAIICHLEILWRVAALSIICNFSTNFAQIFFEFRKSETLIWVGHLVKWRLGRLMGLWYLVWLLEEPASIIDQLLRFILFVLAEAPLASAIQKWFWSLLRINNEALGRAMHSVWNLL